MSGRATVLALAVLLGADTGCSFGFGTPYPAAAIRRREYLTCSSISGSTCYDAQRRRETGGGGGFGFVAGVPLGGGRWRLGERAPAVAVGVGARLDANLAFGPIGVGLTGELSFIGAETGIDSQRTSMSFIGFPVGAYLIAAPVPPLVLRAGAAYATGTVAYGDMDTDVSGYELFVAGGMSVPFPGLHWVPMLEWRRHELGDVTTDHGVEHLAIDTFMFTLWNVY